jgi:hypothetical protein
MHDIYNADNQVDRNIVESSELLGKECLACFRILPRSRFRKDSSQRDGIGVRCEECERTPALSIAENTSRLREQNYNSAALKALRPDYIDSLRDDLSRIGRVMDAEVFLEKLKTLLPGLRWIPGQIEGDISVYMMSNHPDHQPLGYHYLWYIPRGPLPEMSLHEFDSVRDFPVKEKKRGWRTPLLRCILAGLISEEQADKTFGRPVESAASELWRRRCFAYRNKLNEL